MLVRVHRGVHRGVLVGESHLPVLVVVDCQPSVVDPGNLVLLAPKGTSRSLQLGVDGVRNPKEVGINLQEFLVILFGFDGVGAKHVENFGRVPLVGVLES